jgi:glycosyltransferase involved in cell wall biosynthesis
VDRDARVERVDRDAAEERAHPVTSPTLSIVVPTRDSARTLAACLASVAGTQTPWELIVVDNGSCDATLTLAGAAGAITISAGPERSAQRNVGLARSSGEVVAFLDSDMVAPPGLLDEAVACIAAGADAVILTEVSVGEGFWSRVRALERACYHGVDEIEACRVVRRELLVRLGGFDESLWAFEDWDLTARVRAAGAVVLRTRTLVFHDEGRRSLRHLAGHKARYGAWLDAYRRKHPALAARQLSPWRRARWYLRRAPTLARDPLASLGLMALKLAEAAGVAATALRRRRDAPVRTHPDVTRAPEPSS